MQMQRCGYSLSTSAVRRRDNSRRHQQLHSPVITFVHHFIANVEFRAVACAMNINHHPNNNNTQQQQQAGMQQQGNADQNQNNNANNGNNNNNDDNGDNDDYNHSFQPLDGPRPLTDAEQLFMLYATEGHLELMVDLWTKSLARSQHHAHHQRQLATLATSTLTSFQQAQYAASQLLSNAAVSQSVHNGSSSGPNKHAQDIEIDCADQWGSTPLMHASVRKHVNVMTWLLSVGADINAQDYRGITIFMENCWNNRLEVVRWLLTEYHHHHNQHQHTRQIDSSSSSNNSSSSNSNLTNKKLILDIDLVDERDYTALMQACEEGHSNIVALLLDHQHSHTSAQTSQQLGLCVNVNRQEKKRCYTALMWAVVEGHPPVVQLLVQAGVDLNIQDKYGFTALMQAARTRFLAAVLLLVTHNADLEIRDKKNRNVYDLGMSNQSVLAAIDKGKRELRRRYMLMLSADKQSTGQLPEVALALMVGYICGPSAMSVSLTAGTGSGIGINNSGNSSSGNGGGGTNHNNGGGAGTS